MQQQDIGPADVARVLKAAKVKYVLVGAHAANGYTGRPRATVDVDVVVQFPKKAAKAVAAAFPDLEMRDTPVVTRFLRHQDEVIDLMKPIGSKLWARLLKESREVKISGQAIRVPVLEGVLAAKFAAMVSPHRRYADKLIDAGDFVRIVEGNPVVNDALLRQLGNLVYDGGGEELAKLTADARAGRTLAF